MYKNTTPITDNQEKKKLSCCQITILALLFILLLPLIILFIITALIFVASRINKIQKAEVMEAALTLGFSKIEDLQDEKAFDKIKANYRTLSLKFHTDRLPTDLEENEKKKYTSAFQSISAAHTIFNDKEKNKKKTKLLQTINQKEFEKFREKFNAGKFKDENNLGNNIFESVIQKKEIKILSDILTTNTEQKKQTFLEKIDERIKIMLKNFEEIKKQNQKTIPA